MELFSDIGLVRLKLQLTEDTAPDALVSDCLAAAHRRILPRLRPGLDTAAHLEALASGEALLAGAAVMLRLAAANALRGRVLSLAGQRLDTTGTPGALAGAAAAVECAAWRALAGLLQPDPLAPPMLRSASRPVPPWGGRP